MDINAEIRAELAKQKISVSHLALMIGISRQSASRKLNAESPINNTDLEQIARVLGLPAWELMRRAEQAEEVA